MGGAVEAVVCGAIDLFGGGGGCAAGSLFCGISCVFCDIGCIFCGGCSGGCYGGCSYCDCYRCYSMCNSGTNTCNPCSSCFMKQAAKTAGYAKTAKGLLGSVVGSASGKSSGALPSSTSSGTSGTSSGAQACQAGVNFLPTAGGIHYRGTAQAPTDTGLKQISCTQAKMDPFLVSGAQPAGALSVPNANADFNMSPFLSTNLSGESLNPFMQTNIGYAEGGSADKCKCLCMKQYEPTFTGSPARMIQGTSGKAQGVQLQKLPQISSNASLGHLGGFADGGGAQCVDFCGEIPQAMCGSCICAMCGMCDSCNCNMCSVDESLKSGGLPQHYRDAAPEGHNPEFITGKTGFYACGDGTGQSDDIPAMLHDGDYVMDAETVSALGDGSSKAGRNVLDGFRSEIPHNHMADGGQPVPAQIADGEYVFPAAFVTALGKGDNKRGAEILDGLREKLREHKRSAPLDKIPPKAKSPLEYMGKAKG